MSSRLHRIGVYFGVVDDPELAAQMEAARAERSLDEDEDEPLTRSDFGALFSIVWCALAAISLARSAVNWENRGPWYWVLDGPLLVVLVVSLVAWLGVTIRDGIQTRRRDLVPRRQDVLILVGLFAAIFLLAKVTG